MDSAANFYDTDFFGTEQQQDKSQKFLFESSDPIGFGDDIGGLYENENSIDFSQYIHQSGGQPNSNYDILPNFGLSTSPPKPHEFTLPPLITIKPDPDGPIINECCSVSDIDTAPCTPAVTDSNPASPRSNSDDITGEYMPQIDELQDGEAVPSTGIYYYSGQQSSHQQQNLEPSEAASEPSSAQSSPGSPIGKGGAKRQRTRSQLDKESEEYRAKRERNNVAVRKSRQKSKEKHQGLQYRVDELTAENSRLNKRVELLTKELTVLKSLFTNVGKQAPAKLLNAIPQ